MRLWPILFAFMMSACAAEQPPVTAAVTPVAQVQTAAPAPPVPVAELPPPPSRQPMVRPTPVALPTSQAAAPPVAAPTAIKPAISDGQIVAMLLAASRAGYKGNCPCPDDTDRAGRRCGGRSAYSRPGGAAPLCYGKDVSRAMIEAKRAELGRR